MSYTAFALRISLAVCLVATMAGCCSFQKEWERAASAAAPPQGITGRWAGRWQSEKNQHNGELRCIVKELTNGQYSARFHARYKILFPLTYGYTVILDTKPRDGGIDFQGSVKLSWIAGGTYRYNGHASVTNFHSTYACRYDYGHFQMTRPKERSSKTGDAP
jgi:hypothetical protein